MSIVSFTSHKQGVQDLLAALPAAAPSAPARLRGEDVSKDAKPGFNDLLRDSSKGRPASQRSESSNASDVSTRADNTPVDRPEAEKPEQINESSKADDSSETVTQDASDTEGAEQAAEKGGKQEGESQPKENTEEAQVQAAATAASAQLQVVEAVTSEQPKVQAQANASQQVDLNKAIQAVSKEKSESQAQTAGPNVSISAAPANQAHVNNGPAAQVDVSVTVQPIAQPGTSAQTDSGETGSDSKSSTTTTTVTTAASTSSNSAAATAFAVPEQASGEARLPISTTPTTQSADAAKQVQVQSNFNAGDNDALNTARLTRGLANAVQQRGGAVTLRLTPPEMGTVRIQMQITGTNVSASFHAESASAQTLLTNQLAQLRSALESKGMNVERLSVQPLAATAQSNNTNQSQNQSDTQQQGQSQQQSAGDGRSRGQYSGSSGQQSTDQQQDQGKAGNMRRGFFDRLTDASGEYAA